MKYLSFKDAAKALASMVDDDRLALRRAAAAASAASRSSGDLAARGGRPPPVVSSAHLELVLAVCRAAGMKESTRCSTALCWIYGLLTPHPLERPGLPDEALAACFGFLGADGCASQFVRLAVVCRQFRDVSRTKGPSCLCAAPRGVAVVEVRPPFTSEAQRRVGDVDGDVDAEGDDADARAARDEAYARDASLAATLRWVAKGKPSSLTFGSHCRPEGGRRRQRPAAFRDDLAPGRDSDAIARAGRGTRSRRDGAALGPPRSLGAVFSIGAPRLRSLRRLIVVGARGFDDGAAAAVAAGCEALEVVHFKGTRVGDAGVAALAAGLRSTLRDLGVASSTAATSRLGDVGVAALARVCSDRGGDPALPGDVRELAFLRRPTDLGGAGQLTALDLSRHSRLSDEGVLAIAGGLGPGLLHLQVRGCGAVSDLAPVAVADACANLQSLALTNCARVSDVGALALARHSKLRRASFVGTRAGPVGISALLENCRG